MIIYFWESPDASTRTKLAIILFWRWNHLTSCTIQSLTAKLHVSRFSTHVPLGTSDSTISSIKRKRKKNRPMWVFWRFPHLTDWVSDVLKIKTQVNYSLLQSVTIRGNTHTGKQLCLFSKGSSLTVLSVKDLNTHRSETIL